MTDQFQSIAEFVLRRGADDIPATALRSAALVTMDTLGVAAGAGPMQAGTIARNTAAVIYGAGGNDFSARMLFDGRRVSAAGSAYAAATQIDNLDAHDGYNPTKGHIGVAVIPALFSMAQTTPDMPGPDALAAVVIGYEIAGRAGLSLHATVSDYHTSGAWNAIGVAALAARMRGLSDEQLRHALGIAEYHGPRSQMMREIANPTMLHDGSGWGALAGISAVALAENGFAGAPAITLENEEVATHWADLGTYWQVEHQYIKPYPICRWAHAAIDGVRALMREHYINAEDIDAIDIGAFEEAACLSQEMPKTTSLAQYSMSFAVAVMAVHGRIGLEHIEGAGLGDPAVAAMVDRITVTEKDEHSRGFPKTRQSDVTLTLTNGQSLSSCTVHARGGPEAPMEEAELSEKFFDFATPALGRDRAQKVHDATLNLTRPDSRLSDLIEVLVEPAGEE